MRWWLLALGLICIGGVLYQNISRQPTTDLPVPTLRFGIGAGSSVANRSSERYGTPNAEKRYTILIQGLHQKAPFVLRETVVYRNSQSWAAATKTIPQLFRQAHRSDSQLELVIRYQPDMTGSPTDYGFMVKRIAQRFGNNPDLAGIQVGDRATAVATNADGSRPRVYSAIKQGIEQVSQARGRNRFKIGLGISTDNSRIWQRLRRLSAREFTKHLDYTALTIPTPAGALTGEQTQSLILQSVTGAKNRLADAHIQTEAPIHLSVAYPSDTESDQQRMLQASVDISWSLAQESQWRVSDFRWEHLADVDTQIDQPLMRTGLITDSLNTKRAYRTYAQAVAGQ